MSDRKIGYIAFAICFLISILLLLKRFYFFGSNFDAPIIVNLTYHNLLNLDFIKWEGGLSGSFYGTHTPFTLLFASWISYFQPFNAVEYTSIAFAASCGFLGYIFSQFLPASFDKKTTSFTTILLTVFFVFNFYSKNCLYFVHFELFYLVFLTAFFYYFLTKKHLASYITLFLFLVSREDFGFHLFTIISIAMFFNFVFIKDKSFDFKHWSYIAVICFVSSVMLCYFKSFFPGDQAFSRIYFEPHWPQILDIINIEYIRPRALAFIEKNIYSIANIVILLVFSLFSRTYLTLIPVMSILPWLTIHILAKTAYINKMADYYSFPFAIMLVWPSVCPLLFQVTEKLKRKLYYLQLILLILTFAHSTPFYSKLYPFIKLDNIMNGAKFSQEIERSLQNLNHPLLTWSVATLNPDIYEEDNILKSPKISDLTRPIFYFNNDQQIYKIATENSYTYKYKIQDTPIRILSNIDLTNIFTNLQPNSSFWIEALSLNKKYMYQKIGENMTLGVLKAKDLKKKPLFFAAGNYCAHIKHESNTTLLFTVNDAELDKEIYHADINNNSYNCFAITNPTSLYLTLSTLTGTTKLKEFVIIKK